MDKEQLIDKLSNVPASIALIIAGLFFIILNFSVLPVIGIVVGIIFVILGIVFFRKAKNKQSSPEKTTM
jgi:membrane-bound ClpP family serine protease